MKKVILYILCVTATLSITACADKNQDNEAGQTQQSQTQIQTSQSQTEVETKGKTAIANPFFDCQTQAEAETLAGFKISLPEQNLEEYPERIFRVMEGKLIEVIDTDGEKEIRIRKALGNEEISGDFTQYDENYSTALGDLQITMKGNQGKISTAVWTSGEFAYSVSFSEAQPEENINQVIYSLK